ncbi:G2/mitotic-specific cyclin 2, partial [Phenoliferia sp. Uapishka_3]
MSTPILVRATPEQYLVTVSRQQSEWGYGLSLSQYQSREALLKSTLFGARLQCWVLVPSDDQTTLSPYCACETYRRPVLTRGGETRVGYSIAGVFTPPENRRKGYAKMMMTSLHTFLRGSAEGSGNRTVAEESAWEGGNDAVLSTLYSDIGDYYSRCGKPGWEIISPVETTWTLSKLPSQSFPSSADSSLTPIPFDLPTFTSIAEADSKLISAALDQSPGENAFAMGPTGPTYHWHLSRSIYYSTTLNLPIPTIWGFESSPRTRGHPTNWSFILYTFDQPKKALKILRLRTSATDVEESARRLLRAVFLEGKKLGVQKLLGWNIGKEVLEGLGEERGETREREDSLSALRWYGEPGGEMGEWKVVEARCEVNFAGRRFATRLTNLNLSIAKDIIREACSPKTGVGKENHILAPSQPFVRRRLIIFDVLAKRQRAGDSAPCGAEKQQRSECTSQACHGVNGNENDLAAKGTVQILAGKPLPPKQAAPVALRAKALGTKTGGAAALGQWFDSHGEEMMAFATGSMGCWSMEAAWRWFWNGECGSGIAASTTAATRKRGALAEVTNGTSKSKASTSTAGSNLKGTSKAGSSTTATRRYGTRSSTGGSVVADEEAEQDEDDEDEEEEGDDGQDEDGDDAMVLDDHPVAGPAPRQRVIKALPVPGRASSKPSAGAVPSARPPLGNKRTNTGGASAVAAAAAGLKKATTATARVVINKPRVGSAAASTNAGATSVQARRIVKEKAEALRKAREEFEDAERIVAQHKAKKAKTSDPDYLYADAEDGESKDAGWEDLDEGDEDDPLMVSTYVVEVYDYLRELELTTMPSPDYMLTHTEVTWKMRGILIDWLIEIHTKFRLLPETIFLATNIIDRLLSLQEVSLVKFQLVGITALFIAAKYEEVVCPSVQNFLFMTDGGYEDDEILRAERHVLAQLDFNLSYPNPINFLRRISKADGYDIQSRTMAKYLMEISIVDHKFLPAPPSLIAAAGSWLARLILAKGPWDANLVHYSGYSEAELKPTAQLMLDFVVRNSALAQPDKRADNPLHPNQTPLEDPLPNFIKKYSGKKFFKAFTAVKRWAESEYAPIEFMNPTTRKIERTPVAAVL